MSNTSRLTGTCNRCGLCCQYEAPGGRGLVRCGYLIATGALALVGHAAATECSVYPVRFDGMPVPMRFVRDGTLYGWRRCAKDSPQEDEVIAARGLGRGCSLERADA